MSEQLERLLETELLEPPEDFVRQVMQRMEMQPLPARPSPRPTRWEWVAVLGATLAGIAQLISFMFGIWAAIATG